MFCSAAGNDPVLTQPGDEEQVLHPVAHRGGQRQVDKGLDVEVVHQGEPGVVLGLQGVGRQGVCTGEERPVVRQWGATKAGETTKTGRRDQEGRKTRKGDGE